MRSTLTFEAVLATVLLNLACGGSTSNPADGGVTCTPKPAPVTVVAQTYNYGTGKYENQQVTLTTPTDICTMQGTVANIYAGAKFVIDYTDPALQQATTTAELIKTIRKAPGSPVRVGFTDSGGALVPADTDSLTVTTAYYNFERAFAFFNRIGVVNPSTFGTPFVYYNADLEMAGKKSNDNLLFMSLVQSFLPIDQLNQVPLAVNIGVIGHEYSHAIFNFRVHGQQPIPTIPTQWASQVATTPGANLLAALDEGQADVFGTGVTCSDDFTNCNPVFIGDSLPSSLSEARRLRRHRGLLPIPSTIV